MSDQLKQIVTLCARRHNALRDTPRRNLDKSYMAILNQVREFQLSSPDPERDLLDFLSKPQSNSDQTKATKEAHEYVGEAI